MAFTIVGERFSPEEFENYVAGVTMGAWKPQFVTLHNTASPTLAQRPDGFLPRHMENLRQYYSGMGWRGGPHLFVDDKGIWVFNPLNREGRHSPGFNKIAWGVEMLGDYDRDSFTTGRGAKVRDMAIKALATLHRKMGFSAESLRLHKEDTETDHDCPGRKVEKAAVIEALKAAMAGPAPRPQADLVIFRKGNVDEPAATVRIFIGEDGMSYADAHELARGMGVTTTATGNVGVVAFMPGYSFQWDKPANRLYAVEKYVLVITRRDGTTTTIPLEIRADGMSYADARKMAAAAGMATDRTGAVKIVDFLKGYGFVWDKPARQLRATEEEEEEG